MTRQKTEFGTQVNPGTTDHRRPNRNLKRTEEGRGRPHQGWEEIRNPEKRKRQLNIYGKYFPPQAPVQPGERGRLWAGTETIAPALPFPTLPDRAGPF